MKIIDADDVMERIKQAYEDMGVDTHGVWNKQLAEIFKAEETDVEDIRLCLHKILGAVAQAPTISRPQGKWIVNMPNYESICSVCGAKETDFIYGTEMWYGLGESKFCPSCGARMKGADDE